MLLNIYIDVQKGSKKRQTIFMLHPFQYHSRKEIPLLSEAKTNLYCFLDFFLVLQENKFVVFRRSLSRCFWQSFTIQPTTTRQAKKKWRACSNKQRNVFPHPAAIQGSYMTFSCSAGYDIRYWILKTRVRKFGGSFSPEAILLIEEIGGSVFCGLCMRSILFLEISDQ